MNLWNNLTNWIDNWFNTTTTKPKFKLVKYKLNSNKFNKLILNTTKFNYLTKSTINVKLIILMPIKLNKISLYNSSCNLPVMYLRVKLNSYKINTDNINKINVN